MRVTIAPQNPPVLNTLQPSQQPAGAPAFTLNAFGSNFAANAQIRWNGTALPKTHVSGTLSRNANGVYHQTVTLQNTGYANAPAALVWDAGCQPVRHVHAGLPRQRRDAGQHGEPAHFGHVHRRHLEQSRRCHPAVVGKEALQVWGKRPLATQVLGKDVLRRGQGITT